MKKAHNFFMTLLLVAGTFTTSTAQIGLFQVFVIDGDCVSVGDVVATGNPFNNPGPYTFRWSNGVTNTKSTSSDTLFALPFGNYSVTMTDGAGFPNIASVTVGPPPPVNFIFSFPSNASCPTSNDGSASAAASGGYRNSSITYDWSTGFSETQGSFSSSSINDLAPGSYSITVTDTRGCSSATRSFTIGVNSDFTATASVTDEVCTGGDGTATASPSGGSGTYTYLWSNGETTATITGLSAGVYTVDVSDGTCMETLSVDVFDDQSNCSVSICDLFDALETYVLSLNLPNNTENFLLSKLAQAKSKLLQGNTNAAIGNMNAFINKVNAKTPKDIDPADAANLIADANEIITEIQAGNISCSSNRMSFGTNTHFISTPESVELELFPNPASDEINVNYFIPFEEEATMIIFDMTGKVVFNQIVTGDYDNQTIPVDHFTKGIYYLRMNSESDSKTVKFIKL